MLAKEFFNYPSMGWYHPFSDAARLSRRMNRLTQSLMGRPELAWRPARVFPAINLTEDKENFYVRAELPGFDASGLDISVVDNKLSISGERTFATGEENIRYHRKEREAGKFSRVIGLPGDVDAEKVSATMVNGILAVTIPKSEKTKPRKITIN